jgi:hypothetical protein
MKAWKKVLGISGLAGILVGSVLLHKPQQIILPAYSHCNVSVKENREHFKKSAIKYNEDFFGGDGKSFSGYVDIMAEQGMFFNPVKENIKIQGREKVIEGFVNFHSCPLEWMVNHGLGDVPSKEEKLNLGKELLAIQASSGKQTYINPNYEPLQTAAGELAADRIEFYQKVYSLNVESRESFVSMIREAMTREEFEEFNKKYLNSRTLFYSEMANSIKTYEDSNPAFQCIVRSLGPKIASIYFGVSEKIVAGEPDRIYPSEKKNEKD